MVKTMVSWQAFLSLPPRAPLAFLSRLKLPFPSLSNARHAGYSAARYTYINTYRGQNPEPEISRGADGPILPAQLAN